MGYVILLWHSLGLPYNYFAVRGDDWKNTNTYVLDHFQVAYVLYQLLTDGVIAKQKYSFYFMAQNVFLQCMLESMKSK